MRSGGRGPSISSARRDRQSWDAPNHVPPAHGDIPPRDGRHALRIKPVLRGVNALVQRFSRVVIQNRNRGLANDRPGIDAGINIMNGAPGHFHPVIQGLFPGFETRERRQQRRVNIDDSPLKTAQEIALENAHEPGKDHQIHPDRIERVDISAFRFLVELGAEFAGSEITSGKIPISGVLEDAGAGNIAQHERDFGRNLASAAGIGDGHKIGSLARAKEADAKCFLVVHEVLLTGNDGAKQAACGGVLLEANSLVAQNHGHSVLRFFNRFLSL